MPREVGPASFALYAVRAGNVGIAMRRSLNAIRRQMRPFYAAVLSAL
jgi:hypothetical protein